MFYGDSKIPTWGSNIPAGNKAVKFQEFIYSIPYRSYEPDIKKSFHHMDFWQREFIQNPN